MEKLRRFHEAWYWSVLLCHRPAREAMRISSTTLLLQLQFAFAECDFEALQLLM